MYCEKCFRLFGDKGAVCPVCGSRKIREPRRDDECFLVEKAAPWAEMLAQVLDKNGIPYAKKPVLGAGLSLSLGQGMERSRFYVHYGRWEEARELAERLFQE